MTKTGLTRSKHDFCLYHSNQIWLLLFVDDMLLMEEVTAVQDLKQKLQREFKTKYLEEIKKFIGM